VLTFFQTSFSGAIANRGYLEVIANNLANVNTGGFRASRVEFADRLYRELTADNLGLPEDSQFILPEVGSGVAITATTAETRPGDLQSTGDPLHLAILGRGFFTVTLADGTTAYTRSGSFQTDNDGNLLTPSGQLVSPTVTIPTDAVSVAINSAGEIVAQIADPEEIGGTKAETLGQIQLASFVNERGLQAIGSNLYVATTASGVPTLVNPGQTGGPKIQSGMLETSNVSQVTELTNAIMAQRAYQMNLTVLKQTDEMIALATRLRR
jgi:flagellar basal-body rod protein FlgG